MCPAAAVLIMPVATVALPRDSDHPNLVPLSPTRDVASDASYPVPSLPLHHARSCFRVYQRASPPGHPSPPPTSSVQPPTASDNEVSDLLRGCSDVDVQLDLLHHHHHERHFRCHYQFDPQFSISCDKARWRADDDVDRWQCVQLRQHHVDADDRLNDDELVRSADVTVHAAAAVMNAFYRPSLDFNKMQVRLSQCCMGN